MARRSSSTRGGVSFDRLCNGEERNYSFNLCDLSDYETTGAAVRTLRHKIEDTTLALEIGTGRRIGGLCIGKTLVHSRKRMDFDRMDPDTFRKEGISGRRSYYKGLWERWDGGTGSHHTRDCS